MEIFTYNEIPSTSLQAAEALKAGQLPPFAVVARQQTGGRGRRGRSWSSPAGGIYLSVVMPPPLGETAMLGNLPLWIGARTASWLQRRFNFRVALKWPNDLLFDGRKLGGILVESGIEGGRQGPVVIGIGINCRKSPAVPEAETTVLPVALSEICPVSDVPEDLARDLAEFICSSWQSMALKEAGPDFLQWCPPALRIWTDPSRESWWQMQNIGVDGSMLIEKISPGRQQTALHSADHQLGVGGKLRPLPVFLADVGNSSTKIRAYSSLWSTDALDQCVLFYENPGEPLQLALRRLAKHIPVQGWPLWIAGVAPERMGELKTAAAEAGFAPQYVEKRPVRCHGSHYPLQDLGIDRLAAIEGWLTICRQSEDVAVIASFGTALTVDVVRGDGLHLGGVIAPGIGLGALALHQHTGLLPHIRGPVSEEVLGHSTATAISAGLCGAAAGLVERISQDVIRRTGVSPEHLRIIACGGDRVLAASLLPKAEVKEDLVFRGLKSMVGGGLILS